MMKQINMKWDLEKKRRVQKLREEQNKNKKGKLKLKVIGKE